MNILEEDSLAQFFSPHGEGAEIRAGFWFTQSVQSLSQVMISFQACLLVRSLAHAVSFGGLPSNPRSMLTPNITGSIVDINAEGETHF